MVIDSHAHLECKMDTEEIIKNMHQDGLEKIVTIGTDRKDSISAVKLAEKHNDIYATVGLHPEYVDDITEEDLEVVDKLAEHQKVVAIGEIGLDYHYTEHNKEAQKELFIKQIMMAYRHKLPLVIHCRDAKEDMYEILSKYKQYIIKPSVMHCFSEDREYALKFLELGFYISFAGNITFKKSDRSFLKDIPIDKILVETDAPYLSPEPFRGMQNVPARANITAEKIADTLEMDAETFKKQTIENTYKVFYRMKR
ncbi:MAG: TatD family hydrolase [Clostridia bacterium]|nr:TatD family hydrolase [Clostridia bacterium]